ncbi:MAG: SurA N-terminal domain-containing protein [Candidatus Omnitrophica bacterium]|nr:SurA N-terminal domain-containing protein [Candidatus Omnitrophota bacterium]
MIPSFVIFFTPQIGSQGGGGSSDNFGTIDGRRISRADYVQAYHEAQLRYRLQTGHWPDQDTAGRQMGFDLDREARTRVLMLQMLRKNGIHASDAAVARWIANVFRSERGGAMRMDLFKQFVASLGEKGITEGDLESFARHEVGIQELIALYGLNGKLVTPRAAEASFKFEHQQFETDALLFPASNYLAKVNITTNALSQFYTNRQAQYRIPARVQVSYVKFPLTNFFAEADQLMSKQTNLNLYIDKVYQERGADYFVDTNGVVMKEDAAKDKIKEQLRRQFALQAARKAAGTFAVDLFKLTPQKAENLNELAATNHYPVETTEPFSEYEGPRDLKVLDSFSKTAFALSESEPLALPVVGEDGVYIMALKKKIPSEVPSLDSIKARVTDDYRRYQALMEAQQAGTLFDQTLTNNMARGQTFTAVCEQAKMKPVEVPKFSLSTRSMPDLPEGLEMNSLKELASRMTDGQASRFYPTREGGFILYLRNRLPVDAAEMKEDLPAYLETMRRNSQFQAFSDWLSRQVKLARLAGPETPKTQSAPE